MNKTISCEKFQLFVTIFLLKLAKNTFDDLSKFCVFGLQTDFKILNFPHPPNIIWGCPAFCSVIYDFFPVITLSALIVTFKFYLGPFEFMF